MVYHHRAQSVYSLNLAQETVGDELNDLPIASPLDKRYIAWLGNTTSNLWPLIRIHDDQLAQHIYEQNFDPRKTVSGRILGDESALTWLCEKYGPLGPDTTFELVSETAWVASYRQHYVFEGPDTVLLDHLAQAFAVIKRNLVEADHANDHLFDITPTNSPPRSDQHTMGNGNGFSFQEHGARTEENGSSTESLQGRLWDRIDEEVEDDDHDNGDDDDEDDFDDDERYEHEFAFDDMKGGSNGAYGNGSWE
ncbi:hypothetical protein JMJ35_007089 [Cladonia borealis]|uniref:Uncharacterized protein n=1 Tax=Cladonia borealis TaxID=184061 RepID=A0AA39V094_9LECA|nr:hypothetical protein JMJ35_007089 [Cladonia borealis]